jgi:hypothetical protein
MKERVYFSHKIKDHVILIDDARCFIGKDNYPTLQELKEFTSKNWPNSTFNVEDDIISIYAQTVDELEFRSSFR